jgi:hypothetical protein
MNEKERGIFLGEIKANILENKPTTPNKHQRHKNRIIRWIGTGGTFAAILKICALFTVGAVLLGIAGSYLIIQQSAITLGGATLEVYWDDIQLTEASWTAPEDIMSEGILQPGETETFTHFVSSPITDGDWEVYWDPNQMQFTNPLDEFYGYYFSVTDQNDNPINDIVVMHGVTKTIKFVHSLDSHFQYTPNQLPFRLDIHVSPYVPAPIANPESYGFGQGGTQDLYVLTNDISYADPATLTIIASERGTISPDGQYITLSLGPDTAYSFTYTIQDMGPRHKTAVGTVTVSSS